MVQLGTLVTITSQEEQDFINARVSQKYWMGLSDKDVEGTFKWMDGPEAGTVIRTSSGNVSVNIITGHPVSQITGTEEIMFTEIYPIISGMMTMIIVGKSTAT